MLTLTLQITSRVTGASYLNSVVSNVYQRPDCHLRTFDELEDRYNTHFSYIYVENHSITFFK